MSGGAAARHCRPDAMKHVLPKFFKPHTPGHAAESLTSSWASDSLEKRVPKLGSGNGPCSGAGAPVSKHAMSSNPPGGGKGMGKSPGGGLTKVFSSFHVFSIPITSRGLSVGSARWDSSSFLPSSCSKSSNELLNCGNSQNTSTFT